MTGERGNVVGRRKRWVEGGNDELKWKRRVAGLSIGFVFENIAENFISGFFEC
jgi:hypothetical protein